jgi:uncharacterized protein
MPWLKYLEFDKSGVIALTAEQFKDIEDYMLLCMNDSAHDRDHIYRVLYVALDIASTEDNINTDVLIAACLLHDIGREEQNRDPAICHALAGGEKAYDFLRFNGWSEEFARHVKACVQTHRYRTDLLPKTTEAKIVFDADKIDATGTLGIARTLLYRADGAEPLYSFGPDGGISDGAADSEPSFFEEYRFKLEKLYDKFYTKRASEIAASRQKSAVDFYDSMLSEVRSSYEPGKGILKGLLEE